MEKLIDVLRINVFKFVTVPISLILTDRNWHTISNNIHAKTEWLIYKYGKSHALFHAVRYGDGFITEEVVQSLLSNGATMSRYFLQRLLMHFGKYDERLIELKIEHNVSQIDFDRIRYFQKKFKSPWASNLPLSVFTKLMIEGYNSLNDLATKGNDMELFHFLSAGPLVINQAPQKILQNLGFIEDLILNKNFIPFPPRPKPLYEDTVEYVQSIQARAHEEYPSKDGYENSRQLNVIARAILIHPDLVNLWKRIGYHEICVDVNELVMQGALLILFPPTPSNDWESPGVNIVVARLRQLIELGFQLTDLVMEEAFHLFENRLNEVGIILMNAFQVIRNKSKPEIACSCLIRAIRPERNHRKIDVLEFLMSNIEQPEIALEAALEAYKVGFQLDVNSIKTTKGVRSLSVHSNLYYWVLKTYGRGSSITQKCFEDIIESRIWIDVKLQGTPDRNVPEHLTTCAFNSICSIYLEFCNEKVPFKYNYLSYLQLACNAEIIEPFFDIYLPIVFSLNIKIKLPMMILYEYSRPEIRNNRNNSNSKSKFDEMIPNKIEWFKIFVDVYNGQILVNDSEVTGNFKNRFKVLWDILQYSQVDTDFD
jgi:hypothetical protein